jgi:hypothetical protein
MQVFRQTGLHRLKYRVLLEFLIHFLNAEDAKVTQMAQKKIRMGFYFDLGEFFKRSF